ncbi:M48 family metalloprotease [Sulfurimonas sp.]|uniref:M48 family metalloprotease n=1 Tax=Sulfurimonas sp. TaxID=2022749 RepID=UPI0025FDD46B|nr:M48 family metalloprotease [Sulfurimonas sp.]MBW6487830.1 M48 family metalloprotease [Sulfurimonas sp.]
MFKRVGLFLLTNLGIMIVIGIVVNVFGLNRFLNENGLNLVSLFVFSLVVGFTGSIISLLMSKQMAKMAVGARVITNPANQEEFWLLETVARLSQKAGIKIPEVSRYREYRADEAGAYLSGKENMIAALQALARSKEEPHLPEQTKAFGINGKGLMKLFSTHPSLEERIEKLKRPQ